MKVLLVLIIPVLMTAKEGLSKEVLSSLPYGDEDAQINLYIPDIENVEGAEPAGIFWYYADSVHGNIYIAEVNVIKQYKMNGEFVSKTAALSDSPIISFVVDNEQNIYVIHGGRAQNLSKIKTDGTISWTKTLSAIVSDSNYDMMGPGINLDNIGNTLCEVNYKKAPEDYEKKCLKIDKSGNFIEVVPSDHIDKNGNYYIFHPSYSNGKLYGTELFGDNYVGDYESGTSVEILNSDQKFVKNITILLPEEFKQYENYRGIDQWNIDFEGSIYGTAYVRRDSDKQTIIKGNDFFIGDDKIVYKYDQDGKLISQITFPGYPIKMNRQIQVDENGKIYYLQFYAEHLDVVKVSSDNIAPQTNISITPFPNIAGWNNSDITITLTATDNEGGSGVKEIHYTLTGAVNEDKVIPGQTAQLVLKTEGTTTISYYTLDNTGNKDETKSLILNLDKTAPLVSLNLEPYKIKLPFLHETHHFYTPFFYKLTYSATDTLSGVKGSKTGLITPNINGFKTQLIKGKQLHITVNVDKKHVIIIAPNPQQVLDQLKSNLLLIDNNQVMHLNQRPKAKGWMINKTDKFLVISAPSIVFKALASDYAENLTAKELKYEKKKIPMPDHCKLMINRKELSQEELEDLMEDMTVDSDTMKEIHKNYKVK